MTVVQTLAPQPTLDPKIIEQVLLEGDLSRLSVEQRVAYYNRVCETLGLNPLTQPFKYLTLQGKLKLYALKDATEQLRKIHGVSITELSSQRLDDVFVVTAKAQDKAGRTDAATGAVPIGNLKGENLANALMKAETKAKRRATLSICGLGMLDETEAEPLMNREPQYAVEASGRVALPPGTVQILHVRPKDYGAELTVVDANGEQQTYPVPDSQCAALCEQLAQEQGPVTLTLVTGARDKKVKVKGAARWTATPPTAPENGQPSAALPLTADDIPF
jgi:hypothetical protein